ncbi:hypothetical protein Desdi_0364 [Desulfitobacterium dichloroeliminans LMG P-21439]|uniref:Uncharacterized protein n=1 Tax=Desulfitobacterium dichloroeliminans (strain LMG P-21439 / DCA1) TaxID=871963 RepID=L0F4C9_DESDL|nr:hypothetical protein [Desulfitobacterium dichloroeliminans]AGA67910.1 hypothetical protein Desdi_0364 [Desulfitobacterium dichloroeliminans LMG P-21439]
MVLIVLSLIMGFIGLNIGGIIGGAEIYAYLFGLVGVLSPGLYTLERVYKGSKINKADERLFTKEDESGLIKLRDIEVLSNSQLEEVIEIRKKKADKNENHELYQKYKKMLDGLKQDGFLDEGEYFTSLDKLEEHYRVY